MLLGIDVSKWSGEVNWSKARSAGARFAFARAGACSLKGICYKDYQFDRNSQIAPDYMPIGFYWYFRPQHDPDIQANYFCSLIRDKKYKLPPVIDLEETGTLGPSQVTVSVDTMARQIFHRLDVWPLLYSRAVWLNDHTIDCNLWKLLKLWVARYNASLTGPWSDDYCIPRDFEDWDFWQFSADNNGRGAEFGAKSKSIDLNYFNGGEAKFNEYIGAGVPKLIKITSRMAAVRSGPEGQINGVTWAGNCWPKIGISNDGNYYQVEGWIERSKAEEIDDQAIIASLP
jgi:lysozyme